MSDCLFRRSIVALALAVFGCSPAVGEKSEPDAIEEEARDPSAQPDTLFSPSDILDGFDRVDGWAVSGVMQAPDGATRGGFLVDLWADVGDASVDLEVRGVYEGGATTRWFPAEVTWKELPHFVARADLPGPAPATQIRLPVDQAEVIANISYAAVTPADPGDEGGDERSGVGSTSQALSSSLGNVVEPRSAWGARRTRCSSRNTSKYRMAIHNTASPPSSSAGYEARLRSLQAYHMDTRGWCDIGYHFLVTQDGRVWEGRPLELLGAHVGGNNTGNVGISYVGCFHPGECDAISSSQTPSEASIDGGAKIVRALSEMYSITPDSSSVKGHRDHKGAQTTCPGNNLAARLNDIRSRASSGAPAQPEPTPDPGSPPAGQAPGRVLGVVWDSSTADSPTGYGNVRIGGATLTSSDGSTASARSSDAFWSLDLAPGTYTLTAQASGYETESTTVEVRSGQDTWSSMGLWPKASQVDVTVAVRSAGGQALSGAILYGPGIGAHRADTSGSVTLTLEVGQVELSAFADGYASRTQTVSVSSGTTSVDFRLDPASAASSTGRVQGVVWDATQASSAATSSSARIDSTIVICSCGKAIKARAGDAYWSFDTAPGSYDLTFVAPGYSEKTTTVTVTNGGSAWASEGLTP